MNFSQTTALIDAVLDGEASPDEVRELDRLRAADPAVRSEFDERRQLFDGLRGIAMAVPPADLVASVMDRVPHRPASLGGFRQLLAKSRVFGQSTTHTPGSRPGNSARVLRASRPGPSSRG